MGGQDQTIWQVPVSDPTGTHAAGENCTEPNDCTSGMICIGYNGPPDLCRPLCSDAKPCAAGECIEFDKDVRM